MKSSTGTGTQKSAGADRISIWEWITAAVGALLVMATLVVLVREGMRSNGAPPQVEVRVTDIRASAGGWVARFEARNRGDEVAASLEIIGEIMSGDSVLESASATIDHLPARSRRGGGLFFMSAPTVTSLRLRPVGYQKP